MMSLTAVEIKDNLGPTVLAVSATTWVVGLIAIVLRFLARKVSRAPFWWDDWLIIPAQLFTMVGMILAITCWRPRHLLAAPGTDNSAATAHGFGQHVSLVGIDAQNYALRCIFATHFSYTWSICFIKFSILALYWRIFNTTFLRMPIITLALVTLGWAISLVCFLSDMTLCFFRYAVRAT